MLINLDLIMFEISTLMSHFMAQPDGMTHIQ